MEMVESELLVHINASSTVRDDRNYIAVAKSILDFRPVIITKVSGPRPHLPLSASGEESGSADKYEACYNVRSSFSRQPNLPRPSTAPELTSNADAIELPRTGGNRRRSSSETSSFSNSFAAYHKPNAGSAEGDVGAIKNISASLLQSQPQVRATESLLFSTNIERKRKKPRTEIEYCKFEDVERSAARASDGDDTDSTESASSSQLRMYATSGAKKHGPQPAETPSVIDLTSPNCPDSQVYPGFDSRLGGVNSHEPPASPIARPVDSFTHSQRVDHRIGLLPAEVRAPNPCGGQSEFTTHITKTLKKLTNGEVLLLKHFRPASVCRDIKVLERGYWQFWIRIAEDHVVKESRQRPRATLRLLGSTARKKRSNTMSVQERKTPDHALWTEDEFIQFWENVTLVIESGKVGWATRMTKESEGDRVWKIRAFTWGEMLGHIWMLFLVLSDRLTGKVSMEWISGDGAVVVQMADGKRQSGVWMRKGPEGARGVWGLV